MKQYPYDINSLKSFEEIEDKSLTLFRLDRRREIWNFIASELINIKFSKLIAEKFFTTISLQLFNHLPSIICALIDNKDFNKKSYQLKFNNEIINKILYDKHNEEAYYEILRENFNFQEVNRINLFLRNIYFFGNFKKDKIDLIDHNYNARKFTKKNFNVKYRPSNNFFDFRKITLKKIFITEEFKDIFDQNFEYLNEIFCKYLSINNIDKKIINNFSFFLECFLKFEISIFLEAQKILHSYNFNKIISSSISGFKPSRIITSYNYFEGKKIIKFDDGYGGILHGNIKSAYLNNLNNCTDYYFATSNGKNIAKNFYNDFLKKNNIDKKINFHSLQYENKINYKKNNKIKKKFKYVYFSISYRNYKFHGSGSFHDIDYLNLQNIIFEFLKSNTNELLYRTHPETIIGVKKNPLEKYINTLSFEETIKSGNICVFDSTISSAFWQCVHNQNPIILIRHFNVDDSSMFLSRLQKRCEIIDINNPSETVEILKSLNFKKISENSIEKSKTYYDTFENIIY